MNQPFSLAPGCQAAVSTPCLFQSSPSFETRRDGGSLLHDMCLTTWQAAAACRKSWTLHSLSYEVQEAGGLFWPVKESVSVGRTVWWPVLDQGHNCAREQGVIKGRRQPNCQSLFWKATLINFADRFHSYRDFLGVTSCYWPEPANRQPYTGRVRAIFVSFLKGQDTFQGKDIISPVILRNTI
jgi:hypothetical protein